MTTQQAAPPAATSNSEKALNEAAKAIQAKELDKALELLDAAAALPDVDSDRLKKGYDYLKGIREADTAAETAAVTQPAPPPTPSPQPRTQPRPAPQPRSAPRVGPRPESGRWPEVAAWLEEQTRALVQSREGGTNRKTGQKFDVNYLSWPTVARLLDRGTDGNWDTAVTVTPDGKAVGVSITVRAPDGAVITRESIAEVDYNRTDSKAPPLESAERAAFKRAAALLGVRLPEDVAKAVKYTGPANSSGGNAPAYDNCSCGKQKEKRFQQCTDCYRKRNDR